MSEEITDLSKLGIKEETVHLLSYWSQLDVIHRAYRIAQDDAERTAGVPICIRGCGKCCQNAVPLAMGVEAEYVASWIVAQPDLLVEVLNRCREWLTKGKYTMGNKVNSERWKRLHGEYEEALSERCPFLKDGVDCLIHWARPVVCRAYGVTHLPDYWCPRPLGIGESPDGRITFNPMTPWNPVRPMWDHFRSTIKEPRFIREGFLPLMVFERFKADELAGLMDDGKVPVVKMAVRYGVTNLCLWQDQMDKEWAARAADQSIKDQVPLRERDGKLIQYAGEKLP